MVTNTTLLLIFVTLASVTAQTFQYSRGWTNGKRDGHRHRERELASNLEKILSPCQMNKLKYLLEGKPLNDRVFLPCDYIDDDSDNPKRYKPDSNLEPLFEVLQ